MPQRKMAKVVEGATAPEVSTDRISALPDALLHHVLSLLPAREAVPTCLLSRRWRHLWKSATALHLHCGEEPKSVKKFQLFVEHLLLLRGFTPLEMFELKFSNVYDNYDDARMNLWIRHAVTCQVRMPRFENVNLDVFDLKDLPLVSQHLTRLELVGIHIGNRLLNFSNCPSLEQLQVEHCYLWNSKEISSESLKHLSIINSCFSDSAVIYAPRLVSLWLDGHFYAVPLLQSMPSLQEAFVRVADSGDCDEDDCHSCYGIANVDKFFLMKGLSDANKLALISESHQFIFKYDLERCPTFSRLKTLLLNDSWCVAPDFHSLSCILKHSPVLEKFTLQLFSKGPQHKVEIIRRYNPVKISTTISEHLKAIEVKCELLDETIHKVLKFLGTFNIYFLFK
ncbi:unnamed protein product [Urochloa humidicola]